MDSYDPDKFHKSLTTAIKGFGIAPDDPRLPKLVTHYELLTRFNKIINLTSMHDPSKIAYRLFADSMIPLGFLKSFETPQIIDIGPGGGFPSIPLGVFMENAVFTLVDSRKKVIFFLEELISSISLSNIKLVHGSLDDFRRDPMYTGKFDLAFNKAVFQGDFFLEEAYPFLVSNGNALYWTKSYGKEQKVPDGWEVVEVLNAPIGDSRFPGVVVVYKRLD